MSRQAIAGSRQRRAQVTVLVPVTVISALDQLVKETNADEDTVGVVSRADVIRLALELGIQQIRGAA